MESVMKFKYAFNFSRIICCNFVISTFLLLSPSAAPAALKWTIRSVENWRSCYEPLYRAANRRYSVMAVISYVTCMYGIVPKENGREIAHKVNNKIPLSVWRYPLPLVFTQIGVNTVEVEYTRIQW